MATNIELALMAGRAYQSTRSDINWFPTPQGWTLIGHDQKDSGFEAVSFRNNSNPNEIVISYAGTGPGLTNLDWTANRDLASGSPTAQLRDAALYYCQVRAANSDPNVKITFIGHSLGGGLAALMGVFFNLQAVTFDPAPFRQAADFNEGGITVYNDLLQYLQDNGVAASILQPFLDYGTLAPGGLYGTDRLDEREVRVTSLSVQGEILSNDLIPFNRIGIPDPSLEHGPTDVAGTDLHSQALLTAFVENDQFRQVTYKLTDLLGMIFDSNLYYNDPNKLVNPVRNFLENLIRHQVGVQGSFAADAMLDRFTTDLQKIAQDGGLTMSNSDLTKALTAFAMQAYYDNHLTGNTTLFETDTAAVSGGIRFDRSKVAATLATAKGFEMYFENYLETIATTPLDLANFSVASLSNLLDWFIQAGNQAMHATAGNERAFMLGGSGGDNLTGGSQADLLIGGAGLDTLSGDTGNDTLYGGQDNDADSLKGGIGNDTYYTSNNDIVEDSDYSGTIYYNGQNVATMDFDFLYADGTTEYYKENTSGAFIDYDTAVNRLNGFNGMVNIDNFASGDFGIILTPTVPELPAADRVLIGTPFGDDTQGVFLFGAGHYLFHGAITPSELGPVGVSGYDEFTLGGVTPPNLAIYGLEGNDLLRGLAGYDYIDGGSGDDLIFGESHWTMVDPAEEALLNPWAGTGQADVLLGGVGRDAIHGGYGDDWIDGGDDNDFLSGVVGNDTMLGGGGDDVAAGGAGDDFLHGGSGADFLCGDNSINLGVITPADIASLNFQVDYDEKGYLTSVNLHGFTVEEVDGPGGNDLILGGIGNDLLMCGGGNDTLLGQADNDCLVGGSGNDYLDGGAGKDYMDGGDGNDILIGGTGNDDLYGGEGSDTYLFNRGDGQDTINDLANIRFGAGIAASDITLIRDGDDLILGVKGSSDKVTIPNNADCLGIMLNSVQFADGTSWDSRYIHDRLSEPRVGTDDNNLIKGWWTVDENMQGMGGNDTLLGSHGNDTLWGCGGEDEYLLAA